MKFALAIAIALGAITLPGVASAWDLRVTGASDALFASATTERTVRSIPLRVGAEYGQLDTRNGDLDVLAATARYERAIPSTPLTGALSASLGYGWGHDEDGATASIGAGVEYPINDRFAVGVEARRYFTEARGRHGRDLDDDFVGVTLRLR